MPLQLIYLGSWGDFTLPIIRGYFTSSTQLEGAGAIAGHGLMVPIPWWKPIGTKPFGTHKPKKIATQNKWFRHPFFP